MHTYLYTYVLEYVINNELHLINTLKQQLKLSFFEQENKNS